MKKAFSTQLVSAVKHEIPEITLSEQRGARVSMGTMFGGDLALTGSYKCQMWTALNLKQEIGGDKP